MCACACYGRVAPRRAPLLLVFPLLLLYLDLLVESIEVERGQLLHLLALVHQVFALFVDGVFVPLYHRPFVVVQVLQLALPNLISLFAKLVTLTVHVSHLPPHVVFLLPVPRYVHLVHFGGFFQDDPVFAHFGFGVVPLALQLLRKRVTHVSLVAALLFEVLLLL